MATLEYGSQSSHPFKRNGKILSICADRDTEPVSKVVYRYGRKDAVELEQIATKQAPFFVHSRSTSPHTGEDILFFTTANHTYYVILATGQGNGVILLVYAGAKKVQQPDGSILSNPQHHRF
ncbi:hypothetical protein [Collimonas sp. PA-H2]|uniref:hypothetical protein n=1 Tax=Collimonas sp. PA-H2 TaxID=1881062 RepID=UPI000BF7AB95|nr:hypothetical protein [Collimonas sp. PA-H2]